MNIVGIHMHTGSDILDIEVFFMPLKFDERKILKI
jgi:diaminopimelate decarboxylase